MRNTDPGTGAEQERNRNETDDKEHQIKNKPTKQTASKQKKKLTTMHDDLKENMSETTSGNAYQQLGTT